MSVQSNPSFDIEKVYKYLADLIARKKDWNKVSLHYITFHLNPKYAKTNPNVETIDFWRRKLSLKSDCYLLSRERGSSKLHHFHVLGCFAEKFRFNPKHVVQSESCFKDEVLSLKTERFTSSKRCPDFLSTFVGEVAKLVSSGKMHPDETMCLPDIWSNLEDKYKDNQMHQYFVSQPSRTSMTNIIRYILKDHIADLAGNMGVTWYLYPRTGNAFSYLIKYSKENIRCYYNALSKTFETLESKCLLTEKSLPTEAKPSKSL